MAGSAAIEVAAGQHKDLHGICLRPADDQDDVWHAKLRAPHGVLDVQLPADHLWVKFPYAPAGPDEHRFLRDLDLF